MKPNRILTLAVVAASVIFIIGAAIGTLAIPIVLSMFYSWYWLFLYAGYALAILYVVMYCISYKCEAQIRSCGNGYGGRRR